MAHPTQKAEPATAVVSWVPESIAREIRARAQAGDRSTSAEIRRAIKAHLAQGEQR